MLTSVEHALQVQVYSKSYALDFAASNGWLIIRDQRVIPGEVCPELETSARCAVVGDGIGTY